MESFKKFLIESPQFQKSVWNYVFQRNSYSKRIWLPLSNRQIKNVFGVYKPVDVYHIMQPMELRNLVKLQGSKKSVASTRHIYSESISKGIGTNHGGMIAKLRGTPLSSFRKDVMSSPDESGRRWVDLNKLTETMSNGAQMYNKAKVVRNQISYAVNKKLRRAIMNKYRDSYEEMIKSINNGKNVYTANYKRYKHKDLEWGEWSVAIVDFLRSKDVSPKVKADSRKMAHEIIALHIKGVEKIMKDFRVDLRNTIFFPGVLQEKPEVRLGGYGEWEEIDVNDIKIVALGIPNSTEDVDIVVPKGMKVIKLTDKKSFDELLNA
jgi:hypothetical protein